MAYWVRVCGVIKGQVRILGGLEECFVQEGALLLIGFVTIEDPPVPFSPFSFANCTMLDHFSFNDFIAIAFPDIAGDLDIQI